MITFEQAKTLTEGQEVYFIYKSKIKEAKITSLTVFEAGKSPRITENNCRICYKVKGGTVEQVDWATERYTAHKLYLTKEEVAKDLITELSDKMMELEERLMAYQQKINEAKKFGGLS